MTILLGWLFRKCIFNFLPSGGSYVKCIDICKSDIENFG